MKLIEIVKNVEAANRAIEKLGLSPDNRRKPFSITISIGSLHRPCQQLRKDNSAFFYNYRHIRNALVWTFGDLGRSVLENKDFEAFENDEDTSTFTTEFERNDAYKDHVIVYVNVHDMR